MRNKYGAIKTKINNIVFDSIAESQYYMILLDKKKRGEILDFELQPKFLLQDKFKKNGKHFRAIHYIADFKVFNLDGSTEIVDVKGKETEAFKLKHKLFEYKFPDLSLTLIKGGAVYEGQAKTKKARESSKGEKAPGTRRNISKRL